MLKFEPKTTVIEESGVFFKLSEPLTEHIRNTSKKKDFDELTKALHVIQLNTQVKEKGDKEFRQLTMEEINLFPAAIVRKLSGAIAELTDGEVSLF
jgi:hypothetical protein